jgi:hypothetical protein
MINDEIKKNQLKNNLIQPKLTCQPRDLNYETKITQ